MCAPIFVWSLDVAKKTDYTVPGQQRILQMATLLAGNEFHGLSPLEIRKAMGVAGAIVTRDLDNLRTAGIAEEIPETGRWRLGPKLIQIGLAFASHIEKQANRVEETKQRYTRLP